MIRHSKEWQAGLAPGMLLLGLVLMASALRLWRLGNWSFEGDEVFTLRDSLAPRLTNPRPLLYFLNHYLLQPVVGLDELGLRLLPALFGILAVPVLYLVVRRLINARAALFAALLLTFSGVHIYQSQNARYWSLVFLLSAVYPYALYLGLREHNRRALALGLFTGLLAVLAHPVSVLMLGGLALWLLLERIRGDTLTRLWAYRTVRWPALLVVIIAAAIALRYVPMLQGWIADRDATPHQGDNLFHLPRGLGVKQAGLMLSYVEGLTLPLVLTGLLGIWVLWQTRDRSLAKLLLCLLIFPTGFLVLLSMRTAVSMSYLLPAAPTLFIGAGVLLDRLVEVDTGLRPRWLLAATVALLIISAGAPTVISQYRDGRRHDFRGAARWLTNHAGPGDVVYSDQYRTLTHYLRDRPVRRLAADPGPLIQEVRELEEAGQGGTVWVVAPTLRGGVRTNQKIGSLRDWVYDNCRLRTTLGVARLDFRQKELQVFRCAGEAGASPGESGALSP